MFKSLLLLCLLVAFNVGNAHADCMPHHHLECSFILQYDTSGGMHLDSASLLLPVNYHIPGEIVSWDTVREGEFHATGFFRSGGSYHEYPTFHPGLDTMDIWSHVGIDSFEVLLHFHDRNRVSPVMIYHDRAVYRLAIAGDSVILSNLEVAPDVAWKNYPSALFGTILIELFIGLIYFYRRGVPIQKTHSIITANLISHPILWALCAYLIGSGWGLVLGEIGVVIFEGWWMWLFSKDFLSKTQCFKLSLLMNFTSFVLGGIIGIFFT